jgi:arginine deiminase
MKNIFKPFLLLTISVGVLTSCVKDDDFEVASFKETVYKEVFDSYIVNDDEYLNFGDWTSFVETGSVHWFEKETDDNGYLEFTSYQSGEASNIAWAITPKINLDESENEVLTFKTSSEYVTDPGNKIEVFISSDFDGTNVLVATWTPVVAVLANNSTNISSTASNGFININSGEIDLSAITGDIYIAFKGTGSGTNVALDGSLRLDDIKIYNKNL